jgi:hypothetical protein
MQMIKELTTKNDFLSKPVDVKAIMHKIQLLNCSTAQLLNCSTAQLLNCSTAQLLINL